jgi:hypothetical protein
MAQTLSGLHLIILRLQKQWHDHIGSVLGPLAAIYGCMDPHWFTVPLS